MKNLWKSPFVIELAPIVLVLLVLLFIQIPTFANKTFWKATSHGLASESGNWNNGVPTLNDTAYFWKDSSNKNCTLDVDQRWGACWIGASCTTSIVPKGTRLDTLGNGTNFFLIDSGVGTTINFGSKLTLTGVGPIRFNAKASSASGVFNVAGARCSLITSTGFTASAWYTQAACTTQFVAAVNIIGSTGPLLYIAPTGRVNLAANSINVRPTASMTSIIDSGMLAASSYFYIEAATNINDTVMILNSIITNTLQFRILSGTPTVRIYSTIPWTTSGTNPITISNVVSGSYLSFDFNANVTSTGTGGLQITNTGSATRPLRVNFNSTTNTFNRVATTATSLCTLSLGSSNNTTKYRWYVDSAVTLTTSSTNTFDSSGSGTTYFKDKQNNLYYDVLHSGTATLTDSSGIHTAAGGDFTASDGNYKMATGTCLSVGGDITIDGSGNNDTTSLDSVYLYGTTNTYHIGSTIASHTRARGLRADVTNFHLDIDKVRIMVQPIYLGASDTLINEGAVAKIDSVANQSALIFDNGGGIILNDTFISIPTVSKYTVKNNGANTLTIKGTSPRIIKIGASSISDTVPDFIGGGTVPWTVQDNVAGLTGSTIIFRKAVFGGGFTQNTTINTVKLTDTVSGGAFTLTDGVFNQGGKPITATAFTWNSADANVLDGPISIAGNYTRGASSAGTRTNWTTITAASTVTCNGKNMGNININASGATVTVADNLIADSLTVTAGTLILSGTRDSLTGVLQVLGTSTLTTTGDTLIINGTPITLASGSTLTKNAATLWKVKAAPVTLALNGVSAPVIVFTGNPTITGGGTLAGLSKAVAGNWKVTAQNAQTLTLSALTFGVTTAKQDSMLSSSAGNQATISLPATATWTNAYCKDILFQDTVRVSDTVGDGGNNTLAWWKPALTTLKHPAGRVGYSDTIIGSSFKTSGGSATLGGASVVLSKQVADSLIFTVPTKTKGTYNLIYDNGGYMYDTVSFRVLVPTITGGQP